MKAFLSLLLVGSGLIACKEEGPAGDIVAAINQPFSLTATHTATLPTSGGSEVRVMLIGINDSRCPTNVQCIWAGYAAVDVRLTDASPAAQTARISLGYKGDPTIAADSVLLTLNQRTYWLRLLAVNPYPGTPTDLPQTATLRLRPQ